MTPATEPVLTATVSDIIKTTNTTVSTSTATGALQVAGGAGIAGTVNVGQNFTVGGNVIVSTGLTTVRNMVMLGNVIAAGRLSVTNVVWQANNAPFSGARGFVGSTGFTGSSGGVGGIGFTGSRGFAGSAGFNGSTGGAGAVGFAGSRGFVGSVGFAGSRGFNGSSGFNGSTGFSGSSGVGFAGSRGFVGSTGFTGSLGLTGFTGSIGIGFTGSVGFNGSTGSQGVTPGIKYNFLSGAGTNTSVGNIRLNTASAATASIMYVSISDSAGANMVNGIAGWGESTNAVKGTITVSFNSQIATVSSVWNITDAPTFVSVNPLLNSYYTVPVALASGGAAVQNGTAVILEFARAGDAGLRGFAGSRGNIGFTGSAGVGFTGSAGFDGSQGATGYSGSASTAPGYTGSTGVSGGLRYKFSSTTTPASTPTGNVRFNNSSISSVTNIYISTTDANAVNATLFLGDVGDSTNTVKGHLIFNTVSNVTSVGAVSSKFSITGVSVLGGSAPFTYYTVPVQYVSGTANPANLTELMMQFLRAGDSGIRGYTGSIGTGYGGSRGDLGYTGSQGVQGPIGYAGSSGSIIEPVASGPTTAIMPVSFTANYATGTLYQYALEQNFTLNDPVNMPVGSSITVILTQNDTANVVMTPSANILFSGSKTLSTDAYAIDMINIMRVQSVFAGNNVSRTVFIGAMSKGYGSV